MAGTTGGVGGTAPNLNLRIQQVGPRNQYFSYKGETYMVQAIRRGATTGAPDEDVTPLRDWTEAGKLAMETTEKIFQEKSLDFTSLKTVHVPLVGSVVASSADTPGAVPIDIGTEIKYSRTVTNAPSDTVIIDAPLRTQIQSQITAIGREAAQWKDPTRLNQRTAQTDTPQRTDTATPTPPPTDTTAPIPLPPLIFTAPTPYVHNEEATLSDFLKSQQTSGATTPINTARQHHQPASKVISDQLAQFGEAITFTPEALQKGAASRIAEHLKDFADNPTDCREMFTTLKARYDASTSTLATLKAELKDGVSSKTKIHDREYTTLETCLANKTADQLTDIEKTLVPKAFANLVHKTPYADCRSYPKVYFKAMWAFFGLEKIGGILGFGGTEQSNGRSLVIVEPTATSGEYKIWGRWPDSGPIRPDRTAFLLYESSETNGKFSGFSRTTGMDARNPLAQALPQTGITGRAAYYQDRQDIETGGRGNCGATALADAILQKNQTYYRTKSDWNAALGEQGVAVRSSAMSHLFNQADDFIKAPLFPEVLSAINESVDAIRLQQPQHAATLSALLQKDPGTLLPAEKKWMVQLYAVYAANEGKDLDKPFFLAYALRTGQKIAVIQGNKIILTAPPAEGAITTDDYLFVHYDGTGHFRSVNRNYTATATAPALNDIVSQYNSEHAYLFARQAFLKSFANPGTIQGKLAELKTADPHGYLALQEIVGANVVNDAAQGTNVPNFIIALESSTGVETGQPVKLAAAIELEITARPYHQARIEFLSKMIQIFETQPPLAAPEKLRQLTETFNKLKIEDTAGYLAVQASLKTIVDIYTFNNFSIANFTSRWVEICGALDITSHPPAMSQMALEGAQHLAAYLQSHPHFQARGDFFKALISARTGTLSTDTKRRIDEQLNNLMINDPHGYFAYRKFLAENGAVNSMQAFLANRDQVISYIFANSGSDLTKARANVIKAIVANKPEDLIAALTVLQRSQPNDYLALETILGKGPSRPENLVANLQTVIIGHPNTISPFTQAFANRMHSTEHQLRSAFLNALDAHQAPHADQLATGPELQRLSGELKQCDPLTYFAVDELLLGNVTVVERLAALSADQIKTAIAEKPYLRARVDFIKAWKTAHDSPSPETKQAMTNAIETMKTQDAFGWVQLAQLASKTNTNEIIEAIFSNGSPEVIIAFIDMLTTPESKAAGELIREITNPRSTNESIQLKWASSYNHVPHLTLALGSLVYDKTQPTPPPETPLTLAQKANQGLTMIQENVERLKAISSLELTQKLLTTHVDNLPGPVLVDGPAIM